MMSLDWTIIKRLAIDTDSYAAVLLWLGIDDDD